jgi:hypothetical protein
VAFFLPTFNLTCNVWHGYPTNGVLPPNRPADAVFSCGLRVFRTGFLVAASGATGAAVALILPALSDIRVSIANAAPGDTVECPAGSGRFYTVGSVDDVAKGFNNEYRIAGIVSAHQRPGGWPVPLT